MKTKAQIEKYMKGNPSEISYKQFHWISVVAAREQVPTVRDGQGCTIYLPGETYRVHPVKGKLIIQKINMNPQTIMKPPKQHHWRYVFAWIAFCLFVFWMLLLITGCEKENTYPDPAYTVKFNCISDTPCKVWYGIYPGLMSWDTVDKCWKDILPTSLGHTVMLRGTASPNEDADLLMTVMKNDSVYLYQHVHIPPNTSGSLTCVIR